MMEFQYRPLTVVVPAETDEEWSPMACRCFAEPERPGVVTCGSLCRVARRDPNDEGRFPEFPAESLRKLNQLGRSPWLHGS
jgi:hypothetical protein